MDTLRAGTSRLQSPVTISQFYTYRDYQPAWVEADGPSPWAAELLDTLSQADEVGLRATDYPVKELRRLLHAAANGGAAYPVEQWADLELHLTDAWVTYASHMLFGRLNPRRIDKQWGIKDSGPDLAVVLQQALEQQQPIAVLATLSPPDPAYARLLKTLNAYRTVAKAGGWGQIAPGPKLGKGARQARVQQVKARLTASGDLPATAGKDNLFDEDLAQAVKHFQLRHGLAADGVVGPTTLAEMNVPVEQRLTQLELNLERWRWLPQELGARHIQVNITNYTMSVIEQGEEVFGTKVIVGQLKRPTPVFSADMSYLVLNPAWYVPSSIAVKDKLPKLRRNAYALAGQRIKVYAGGREIDPGSVNWQQVGAGNFPYQLRQDPGPRNALGKIKFMFPNPYNVYLHDTPSRSLFQHSERAFSSGCIRVAEPIELAEYLLQHDKRWTRKAIISATQGSGQRTVNLPEKIPVYLLYWTAWVDEDGTVQFREDIYQRDQRLARAWNGDRLTGA
ncbi:MAG: L,D-transpeptidase family protein [Gammaproteobacteria bacterium]|nr:L,D-transpeptidase family protein [Gammaproteobacteria bacterium]MCP5459338.1 L,D-transpeptidase family protein [Gammaproteobacteria bacterium]